MMGLSFLSRKEKDNNKENSSAQGNKKKVVRGSDTDSDASDSEGELKQSAPALKPALSSSMLLKKSGASALAATRTASRTRLLTASAVSRRKE